MESNDGEGSQSQSFGKQETASSRGREKIRPNDTAYDEQQFSTHQDETKYEFTGPRGEVGLENVAIGTTNFSDSVSEMTMDDKRYKKRKRAYMDDIPRDSIRKGKWTAEEEAYASKIIDCYYKGLISLPEGATLRLFLAEKLSCDPMRVTKKYSKVSYNLKDAAPDGKVTSISIPTQEETQIAKTELEQLEESFRERTEKTSNHAARNAAAKAARMSLTSSAFSLPFSSAVSTIQSQLQSQYLQQQSLTSMGLSNPPQNPLNPYLDVLFRSLSAQQQPPGESSLTANKGNEFPQSSGMTFQNIGPIPSPVFPSSLATQPLTLPAETTGSQNANQSTLPDTTSAAINLVALAAMQLLGPTIFSQLMAGDQQDQSKLLTDLNQFQNVTPQQQQPHLQLQQILSQQQQQHLSQENEQQQLQQQAQIQVQQQLQIQLQQQNEQIQLQQQQQQVQLELQQQTHQQQQQQVLPWSLNNALPLQHQTQQLPLLQSQDSSSQQQLLLQLLNQYQPSRETSYERNEPQQHTVLPHQQTEQSTTYDVFAQFLNFLSQQQTRTDTVSDPRIPLPQMAQIQVSEQGSQHLLSDQTQVPVNNSLEFVQAQGPLLRRLFQNEIPTCTIPVDIAQPPTSISKQTQQPETSALAPVLSSHVGVNSIVYNGTEDSGTTSSNAKKV